MGYRNILDLDAERVDGGRVALRGAGIALDGTAPQAIAPGPVTVALRPEDVEPARRRRERDRGPRRDRRILRPRLAGRPRPTRWQDDLRAQLRKVSPGDSVRCAVAAERVLVFPRESGRDCAGAPRSTGPRSSSCRGLLVVLLLFIYPFLYGLFLSFEPKEGDWLANYLRFFSEPFLYNTIETTLSLAIPTTLVNVGLALPIAFRIRRNSAWQRVLTTILVLPITLGTVLIAGGC